MSSVISAITNTVPISQFNRGLAGKIFSEVRSTGAKVVMKNNCPECVLLSPEEYVRLINEVNEAKLMNIAAERMEKYHASNIIDSEEMDRRLNITETDLAGFEEVEIE